MDIKTLGLTLGLATALGVNAYAGDRKDTSKKLAPEKPTAGAPAEAPAKAPAPAPEAKPEPKPEPKPKTAEELSKEAHEERVKLEKELTGKYDVSTVHTSTGTFVYFGPAGIEIDAKEIAKYEFNTAKPLPGNAQWVKLSEDALYNFAEIKSRTEKVKDEDGNEYDKVVNEAYIASVLKDFSTKEQKIDDAQLKYMCKAVEAWASIVNNNEMVEDPKTKELVPKTLVDKVNDRLQQKDDSLGKGYSFTMYQLREISAYEKVSPGNRAYASKIVGVLDKCIDKRIEELVKEGKVKKEEIDDLKMNAEVVYILGGPSVFEIRLNKKAVFKVNITDSDAYGGNAEERLTKAAKQADY